MKKCSSRHSPAAFLTTHDRCCAQGTPSSAMVISSSVSVDHCHSFRRHARSRPGQINLMLSFQCAQRKVARRSCAETLFAHPDDVRTFVPGGEKCKFAVPEKALKVFRRLLQSRRSPLKPRRRVDPVLRDALVVSPSSFATPVDARLRRRRRAERRARWRRRDSGCCCFPTAPLTPTVHMSHAPVNGTGHDE